MEANLIDRTITDDSGEERLWRAVIANTVREWLRGPVRLRREAERFLFHDDEDFKTVCYSAGINPWSLRERLQRIRARMTAQEREQAPVARELDTPAVIESA
jgi:hypothetical protein